MDEELFEKGCLYGVRLSSKFLGINNFSEKPQFFQLVIPKALDKFFHGINYLFPLRNYRITCKINPLLTFIVLKYWELCP